MNEVFQIYSVEKSNDDVDVVSFFQLAMLDIVLTDERVDKSATNLMSIYHMQVDRECGQLMDNENLDDRNIDNHHFVN
jgi:hypothetical protein